MKKLIFWLDCLRAYALPMSFMAWVIPFTFAYTKDGNLLYGLVALLGIICVHLGANLFDDIIDYKRYLKNKETDHSLNLKKGKCKYFLDEQLKLSTAFTVVALLFGIALLVGIFFVWIYKLPILLLIGITGILCLLYPASGYLGLSEVIVGAIYSTLLFTGVFYVMTGTFSSALEWLSLSFALVTVTLLYTDFFLDYNIDKQSGKMTLPIISGSKSNAYYLYIFIIFLIYATIFLGIHAHVFPVKYGIIFLSVVPAFKTIGNLQSYITKEIKDEAEFLRIMNDTQKFIAAFSILCVLAFVLNFFWNY